MDFYGFDEVVAFLEAQGCERQEDKVPYGTAWITKDGLGFLLPDPDDSYKSDDPDYPDGAPFISAALVDRILSDRWITPVALRIIRFRRDDSPTLPLPPQRVSSAAELDIQVQQVIKSVQKMLDERKSSPGDPEKP